MTFAYGEPINRLWGIPILGFFIRAILLIPHLLILWLYGVVVGITVWLSWIPVLFLGHQSQLVITIIGGYTRWAIRVASYLFIVTGGYPPFTMGSGYNPEVRFEGGAPINRLWGIPFLGFVVRYIVLIPHLIVLFFLGVIAAIVLYFAWLPVLILGRQATPVLDLVGGTMRYSARVYAYLFLITDRYPPFRLAS